MQFLDGQMRVAPHPVTLITVMDCLFVVEQGARLFHGSAKKVSQHVSVA
jgi:hypothetical protein